MGEYEDKRTPRDDEFSKKGGYVSGDVEMTVPVVPEGPAPGGEQPTEPAKPTTSTGDE